MLSQDPPGVWTSTVKFTSGLTPKLGHLVPNSTLHSKQTTRLLISPAWSEYVLTLVCLGAGGLGSMPASHRRAPAAEPEPHGGGVGF